ncbi:hypothetical protein K3495_g923 [Podosphaera aphanis]|nr:hypothetical protein K3495_g923 [Podosphaera aphanis]
MLRDHKYSPTDIWNMDESGFGFGEEQAMKDLVHLVPDASTFCGDKGKFPTWKGGVLLKLTANSDHYPTEQAKMTYVYSMLDSDNQDHLMDFSSLSKIMDHLTTLFDNPNRVRDAQARLHATRQKNKSFSSWIAEIRRDAAISGYDKKPHILLDIILPDSGGLRKINIKSVYIQNYPILRRK